MRSNTPSKTARLYVAFLRYIHNHVLSSVLIFLVSCWLLISWLVFEVEHKVQGANITTYGEALWWGVVTFLTIGYGDRYPVGTEGRVLAGLLMLAGVLAVGILTAKISSYFLEKALREGRGFVDTARLKDHFVICGWKEDMHEILTHILDFNPTLTSDKIVMIANIAQSIVDEMRAHPKLQDLHVVVGDYFSEINLQRAAPQKAKKL